VLRRRVFRRAFSAPPIFRFLYIRDGQLDPINEYTKKIVDAFGPTLVQRARSGRRLGGRRVRGDATHPERVRPLEGHLQEEGYVVLLPGLGPVLRPAQ
jgi:hypothetical protein